MPTGAVAPGGRGRRVWNTTRFETWTPSTFSAGYDAHQATKALDLPASPRMFHRALTLRKRLVIGTRRPVASSIAWKSATPWTSGPTPVTIRSGRGRRVWNTTRFETWTPSTFSAGYDAHQATKALDLPASPRMFHRALTLRKRLVIGTRRPVASSIAWKSATPWTSGPTPVTI